MMISSMKLLPLLGLAFTIASGCSGKKKAADPNRIVLVDTLVEPTQIVAGATANVSCAAATAAGEIVTDRAFSLVLDPATAATATGLVVTSTVAGTFTVACRDDGAPLVDTSPVTVTVVAGAADHSVLTLGATTITAGASTAIACYVADGYGNRTADPAYVASDPAGITVSAGAATGTVVGSYDLRCDTNAVGPAQQGTATLAVTAGAIAELALQFVPELLSYSIAQPVRVTGIGLDAYGNLVAGATVPLKNLAATPAGHHTVTGEALDRIRFDVEGKYLVTAEASDGSGATAQKQLVVDQTPPVLTLTSPERGVVQDTVTPITVAGTVSDNLGEIASLTINGVPVTIAPEGGAFSVLVPVSYGLDLLRVEAADPYGLIDFATRAAEVSTQYYPMDSTAIAATGVANAVALVLTQEAIDDGDHSEAQLDDLASVFKLLIDNLDVSAFIQNPLTSFGCIGGNCTLDFTGISSSSSDIALTLQTGKIHMHVVMHDFAATITLWAPCGVALLCASDPLPLPGSAVATQVIFDTDIVVTVSGGQTESHAENTTVTLQNFGVDINDPTGIMQGLINGALSYIQAPLTSGLETLIAGLVQDQIGSALGGLFDALNITQTFDVPAPVGSAPANTVQISMAARSVDISPERLQLRLDGIAYAVNPVRPYASLGSIGHDGCAPYTALTFPPPSPMTVGLHDSFINQLLYAVWEGGTLSLNLGPGDAAGLGFEIPLQNLELSVEPLLPPVYNSCGGGGERLQLGDLYLDLEFDFGGPAHIALWLQAESAVHVEFGVNATGGNQIQLVIGDLDPLDLDVVTNEGYFAGDDQAVVDLITSLVPQLLSTVTDKARFDLPAIDLGAITPAVPAGTILNLDVQSVGRDNAYLTVNGKLK